MTTRFNVPPFIVTLGGMTVWRGATLILNDGAPISGFNAGFRWWGRGDILGIPVPVLVFFIVAVAGYVVLRYTRYGRQVYAVGGNARSGAPVRSQRELRGVQRLRHHRVPDRAGGLSACRPA